MELKKRFLNKVAKSGNCWMWKASTRNSGYGAFKVGNKVIDAHRISYVLFVGEIESGMLVCHKCDNKLCVNPDHLFLGTYTDNIVDAITKGRRLYASKPKKHPSMAAYSRRGCRCDECKELWNGYLREHRKKLKETA